MSGKILRPCEFCGNEFLAKNSPSTILRGWGRFCSPECSSSKPKNDHWEIAPGITCIVLTQQKYALVDTCHYPLISKLRWFAIRGNTTYYAASNVKFSERSHQKTIRMHRMILDCPDHLEIDHIDGNGLNNSSIFGVLNIRVATDRLNSTNKIKHRSGIPVGAVRHRNKWTSKINFAGKSVYLGIFETPELAHSAYMKAFNDIAKGTFILPSRVRLSG